MTTVKLRFSALPSHVRTARLVAAAVARRAGVDESVLDEVRLAVGEACSRAVGLHRRNGLDAPVTVTLIQEAGRFSIEVTDRVPSSVDLQGLDLPDMESAETPNGRVAPAEGAPSGHTVGPSREARYTAVPGAGFNATGLSSAPSTRDRLLGHAVTEPDPLSDEAADSLSVSMGLAVISGLVDDLQVHTHSEGAVIRMSWPAAPGRTSAAPAG